MNAGATTCLTCGTPISAEVLGGKCPACLKRVALMEQTLPDDAVTQPSHAAAPPAPAGTFGNLDDYEIIAPIAHGGMGIVYRARQRRLKREVALKMVLSGSYADAEELRRFRVEAEAVARLDHPNIVPLFEAGEQDGRPWFSMRLLEGGTLAQKLSDASGGRLDPHAAAALVAKIARAVHHAHQRGLLHRDLKPANILLDAEGEPHVSDFGLAKPVEEAGHTVTGAVLGTPGYMAPEQAAGKTNELTTAVDVFALGAILYHALTGRPPFDGSSSLEVISNVIKCEPARPSTTGARVDRDLETVCLHCLEKEPAMRYGSAEALAEDMERWLRGEPVSARRTGTLERMLKWARRRPAIAALWLLSGGLLTLGVAGIFWQWQRAEVALDQSRESLWKANYERARSVRVSVRMGQRSAALSALRDAAAIRAEPGLRDEALAALALPDFEELNEEIDLPKNLVAMVVASGSGKWVTATSTGALVSGDMKGGVWRTLLDGSDAKGMRRSIVSISVSDTGRLIAWQGSADMGASHGSGVLDAEGIEKPLFLSPWRPAGFAPDDRSFVVTTPDGRIEWRSWPAGDVIAVGKAMPPLSSASISHDGTELTIAGRTGVEVFRNQSGQLQRTAFKPISGATVGPSSPRWHPETRVIAMASDASVSLWSVDENRAFYLGSHEQPYVRLWFHPSGHWLLSHAKDGVSALWNVPTGKLMLKGEIGIPLGFSADGSELWSQQSTRIKRLRFYGDPACRVLTTRWGGSESIDQPRYHSSGRVIVADARAWLRAWVDGAPCSAAGFVAPLGAIRFLKDGQLMISGLAPTMRAVTFDDNHLRIGAPVPFPHATDERIAEIAQSPDGREITFALFHRGLTVSVNDQKPVRTLTDLANFSTVRYSADGKWLVGGHGRAFGGEGGSAKMFQGHVAVWDLPHGKLVRRFHARACDIEFSPDSRWLVIGDSESCRQYSTHDWHLSHAYTRPSDGQDPPGIAFSPDGRLLAMHHNDGRIQLIDPETHKSLATLTPPTSTRLRRLAFSPDGGELAAGSDSGLILWQLASLRASLREIGLDWAADEPIHPQTRVWTSHTTTGVRVSLAQQPAPPPPPPSYQALYPERVGEYSKPMQYPAADQPTPEP